MLVSSFHLYCLEVPIALTSDSTLYFSVRAGAIASKDQTCAACMDLARSIPTIDKCPAVLHHVRTRYLSAPSEKAGILLESQHTE